MQLLALLTTALLLPMSLTQPTTNLEPRALTEKKPYKIQDVNLFIPSGDSSSQGLAGYFTLTFRDVNQGLKLVTQCTRVALPPAHIADGQYYPCANETVAVGFNKAGGQILVQRSYRDPAVGPPGMDIVTAFGRAKTNFTSSPVDAGTVDTTQLIRVPVTSEIARAQ